MPVHDWQFWVVTAFALIAVVYIIRALLPAKYRPGGRRGRGKRTTITVDGKSVSPKK